MQNFQERSVRAERPLARGFRQVRRPDHRPDYKSKPSPCASLSPPLQFLEPRPEIHPRALTKALAVLRRVRSPLQLRNARFDVFDFDRLGCVIERGIGSPDTRGG